MNNQTERKVRSIALDACRAVAVLGVILCHLRAFDIIPDLAEPFANWPKFGMFGVDLFYVLSGFLIAQAVLRPATWNPGRFLLARVTRIYPAYLISLLLIVGAGVLLGHQTANVRLLVNVLLHTAMLHNFLPEVGGSLNGVYWTLGVEFPFYILMLALAPFLRNGRKFWYVSSAMLAACILWRAGAFFFLSPENRFFATTQLPGSLDAFFLGGMAAMLNMNLAVHRRLQQLRWPILVAGIICLALSLQYFSNHLTDYWTHDVTVILWRTSLEFSFALIVFACAKMRDNKYVSYSGLPWIGKISFSLYLYHLPAILFVRQLSTELAMPLKLLLSVFIMLLMSWLSWRFVETRYHQTAATNVQN